MAQWKQDATDSVSLLVTMESARLQCCSCFSEQAILKDLAQFQLKYKDIEGSYSPQLPLNKVINKHALTWPEGGRR